MRKIKMIYLFVLVIIVLTACSPEQTMEPTFTPTLTNTPTAIPPTSTDTPLPPTLTPTNIPPTPTPEPTKSKEFSNAQLVIELTDIERSQDLPDEYGRPPAGSGYEYISVHLKVIRIKDISLVGFVFEGEKPILLDSNSQRYTAVYGNFSGVEFKDKSDLSSAYRFVEGAEGVLVFEVPEGLDLKQFTFIYSYQEVWEKGAPKKRGELLIPLD